MLLRTLPLLTKTVLLALILSVNVCAQDIGSLKPGVVRIQNNRTDEVGTGFIIKVDGTQVYIMTAAHVVKGDQHPRVYLFTQQHDSLQADLLDREDDDTKGLALLRLKLPSRLATGITALKLGYTSQLDGGEEIKVIGFPDGTEFWTVGNGSVARIEGRNLVFSGAIRGGNSGGPVISNGLVLGMVTDVGQASAYAARGEAIEPYVNGIVPKLISLNSVTNRPPNQPSNDEFCQTLLYLLDESKNGFYSIVGTPTNAENTFSPKIMMPGATVGFVSPPKKVQYRLLTEREKGPVESLFYSTVSKVRRCWPKWEEKEDVDSSYKFYKFRKNEGGVVVDVYYNPTAQRDYYYLLLSIAVPDQRRREW